MATWEKESIFIPLHVPVTGAEDTTGHTVEFQPINQGYPTGAILGVQCTTNQNLWQPASDLDDELDYDIYCDGSCITRLPAKKAVSSIGI